MKKNTKPSQILTFELDLKIYPLEAIIGASYMFIDKAYIFLDSHKANRVEVCLKSKGKVAKSQLDNLKSEFFNELLHNTARINTVKRNKKIREFIVGRALFSAIEDATEDSEEDIDDPLGIAVPWGEKHETESRRQKTESRKK